MTGAAWPSPPWPPPKPAPDPQRETEKLELSVRYQLREELSDRAHRLGVILGPEAMLEFSAYRAADRLALSLRADDEEAAEAVSDLLNVLWPTCDPEECGQAGWWQTPLGQVCAGSLGRRDAQAVTHSVAAAMLGVHRGTVSQLVHRERLDKHPDGGITRASVLARINGRRRVV